MSEEQRMAYLVSHGYYSDYCIIGVFSTREKAEAFVEAYNARVAGRFGGKDGAFAYNYGEEAEVEEYPLDEPAPATPGCFVARVQVKARFSTPPSVRWEDGGDANRAAHLQESRGDVTAIGYGETREHARRAASDLHRAVVAGTVVREEPSHEQG